LQGTRRLSSAFELPSSSAPLVLEQSNTRVVFSGPTGLTGSFTVVAQPQLAQYDRPFVSRPLLAELAQNDRPYVSPYSRPVNMPSSTALGMARLKDGHVDLYEPGTRPERQYKGLISVFDHDAGVEPLPTVVGGSGNVNAKEQEYDNDSELDDDLDII
jgi:hypothetical protein